MGPSHSIPLKKNLLLFGPPGSGKGTQSTRLCKKFPFFYLSTGDLFRKLDKNSSLGQKMSSYMDKGLLVPDEMVVALVKESLEELGDRDFILDGFPRSLHQAQALETMLSQIGRHIDKVIFLDIPEEEMVSRICSRRVCPQCGGTYGPGIRQCESCQGVELVQRKDDREDVIRVRYKEYEKNMKPLKGFYGEKGILEKVNGQASPDQVFVHICQVLGI